MHRSQCSILLVTRVVFNFITEKHTGKIRDILDVSLSKQTLSKMQRIIMILWINRSPMQMKNFGTKFSWKSLIDIARRRIKEKAFFPVLPRVYQPFLGFLNWWLCYSGSRHGCLLFITPKKVMYLTYNLYHIRFKTKFSNLKTQKILE